MRIIMVGIDHRGAAVELRERVSFQGEQLDGALDRLRQLNPLSEAVVISTCNRTEIYIARPVHQDPTPEQVIAFLARESGTPAAELTAVTIQRDGEGAVRHLFRVCAGLESMVLGEPQILGQVKRAYEHSARRQALGPVLHRVFQQAIALGKQVRAQTGISAGRASVGSVAVDFARRIFERFDDKVVAGIGAGDMAKVALTHLKALRPARLWLLNRTVSRAQTLAERLGVGASMGGALGFDELDRMLVEADIIITSTGSAHPFLTVERVKPALRRRRGRALFIIDIALPRDAEPAVGELNDVFLYNLDDLQRAVGQTHEQRADEVQRCEAMIEDAVKICYRQVQHRDVGKLIRALRRRLDEIGQQEQERTSRKLAAAAPDQAQVILQEHTHRLINKILHLPLSQLDSRDTEAPLAFHAAALRSLFGLHDVEDRLADEPIASKPAEPSEPPEPSESPVSSKPDAAPQTSDDDTSVVPKSDQTT